VFAFLIAARFAALIVSLPPYQFARDTLCFHRVASAAQVHGAYPEWYQQFSSLPE
jgi:hypothetical protein